jgi:general secretion pathway protein K
MTPRAPSSMTILAMSRNPRASCTQRGLALIVAMLIAALAAAVAVSVATAQSQWSSRVLHRRDQVEAQSIALAGVAWARQILEQDGANAGAIDHLREPWALPLPPTPIENGEVEGRIVDAQGMLNVNNLASATHGSFERRRFARLFAMHGVPIAALAPIVDWVDADDVPQPGGAEDAWYVRQSQPSLAANAPATRVDELAYVRGMTASVMSRLAPFVTALPVDTPLNVNTASADVLAASLENARPEAIAALVASRAVQPFSSVEEFRERVGAPIGDEAAYAVASHYFIVTVRARQGETLAHARALVERTNGASAIVWQTVE